MFSSIAIFHAMDGWEDRPAFCGYKDILLRLSSAYALRNGIFAVSFLDDQHRLLPLSLPLTVGSLLRTSGILRSLIGEEVPLLRDFYLGE